MSDPQEQESHLPSRPQPKKAIIERTLGVEHTQKPTWGPSEGKKVQKWGKHRKPDWEKTSKPKPSQKPFLIVSSFLVFAFLLVTSYFLKEDSTATSSNPPPDITAQWDQEFANALQKKAQSNTKVPQPEEVARYFTQATSPEERLRWCRHPDLITQLLPEFPEQALREVPSSLDEMDYVTTATGLFFHRFVATFANGDRRLLAIIHTDEGPKVDWEAYARHSSAPWPDILSAKTSKAHVRVIIAPSSYYNFQYKDDQKWTAYQITSPDIQSTIISYCDRSSSINQILLKTPPYQRVTLELSLDKSIAEHRQCQLTDLLAIGWIVTDEKPQVRK